MTGRRAAQAAMGTGALLVGLVAGPVAAGAATTTTTAPAVTTAGAHTPPAQTLLAASLAAAGAQRSAHYVAVSSLGTRSVQVTSDASNTAATQSIVIHVDKRTGHVTARFVNKTVYFRGDSVGLQVYIGMPDTLASRYSGKWIAFHSSTAKTKSYAGIAKAMGLSSAVQQLKLTAPITATGRSTQNGHAALGLRGTTTALSSSGGKGTATLYVAATGSPLPIAFHGSGEQTKKKETGTVMFRTWGETVNPQPPASSVPASSITSTSQ